MLDDTTTNKILQKCECEAILTKKYDQDLITAHFYVHENKALKDYTGYFQGSRFSRRKSLIIAL